MLLTVGQQLNRMTELYGEAIAFQYYDEALKGIKSVPYREYVEDVRKTATYLKSVIPDIKGKHIAFIAKNSYIYATHILGTILAGGVAVPLNIEKTIDEIQYELDNSASVFLLHDGVYSKRNEGFIESLSIPNQLLEFHNECIPAEITEDSPERMALLIYTSGTTERSKGVMICQKGLYTSVNYVVVAFDEMKLAAPKYFFVLPLYHISGIMGVFSNGAIGATINICPDLMFLYRDLKLMPSDTTSVSPIIVNSWYKDIKKGHIEKLGGLKTVFVGGASLNPDLISTFTENHIMISQGYGMTEVGGISGNTLTDLSKIDSIGKPTVGSEIKFIDDEICVRSGSVMMGYYNDPVATANTIVDGWLHTGDLGYMDSDGYIYITGRKKNLIILDSGENVQPELLENRIIEIEGVKEVLVHEKEGKICATIVCESKNNDAIMNRVKEINKDFPLYSRVTLFDFSETELEKTSIGKIKRGK